MTTGAYVNGSVPISASFASATSVVTFDDILTRFESEVYRFLLQLTRSRDQAEELYQETLTKAVRAFDRLDGTVDHRAWIYKLATSAFLGNQRRVGRDELPDEASESAIPEDQADHPGNLYREVEAEMVRLPAKL